MNGLLLVDKPPGRSSHSVVAEARRVLGTRKVGHAGTLDPMASGLLVLGVGAGTRLLTFLVGLPKSYEATVRFGITTTTEDADGDVLSRHGVGSGIDETSLSGALDRFTGTYLQRPSSVSAIKVSGRRAYDRVRAGEAVSLEPREVTVGEITVVAAHPTRTVDGVSVLDMSIRTQVSSGTYVRALARDLGDEVGTGAHLTALRRTAVGPFSVVSAVRLDHLTPTTALLDPGVVATTVLPTVVIGPDEAVAVTHGVRLPCSVDDDGPTALVDESGGLLSIASCDGGRWRHHMVIPTAS